MSASLNARLARGGLLGFVGAATSALLGFALTIVLSRMLGSQGAGIVMQAVAVFSLVLALAKFGLDSTSLFLFPRLRVDAVGEIRQVAHFIATSVLGFGMVSSFVVYFLADIIWADANPALRASVQAIAFFIPFGSGVLVATASLRGLGSMRAYVLVQNIALPAMRPPAVALAAVATGSVVIVTISWALPLIVVLGIAGVLLMRKLAIVSPDPAPTFFPSKERTQSIIRFSVPRTLTAGLEQLVIWLDVLIVGGIAGSSAAGIYAGASRFIQAGMIIDSALRLVVSPRFSQLSHEKKHGELQDLYTLATTWLVLFASPIYLLLAVYAPVVMSILGPEFVSGAGVVVVLSLGTIVTFLVGNINSLLLMSGHSGWAAFNKTLVISANVVGNLLFVPRYGIIAAAATWSACMFFDAVLATLEVKYLVGVQPRILRGLSTLGIVVFSVGIPALIVVFFLGQTVLGLIVALTISLPIFVVTCYFFRSTLEFTGLFGFFRRK